MNTNFKIAFENYTKLVKIELNRLSQKSEGNIYKIYSNEIYEINKIISILEKDDSFDKLVLKTKETYFSRGKDLEDEEWIDIAQTFFRKSEFYYNCYKNIEINTINLFDEYNKSMERDIVNLYYIAPLGNIDFPIDCIEFDTFNLSKLNEIELESIINNKTREIFYPNCFLGPIYLDELLNRHSILFSKPYKVNGLRGVDYNYIYHGIPGNNKDYGEYLKKWVKHADEIRYINYPKDLFPILHRLSLFDWENNNTEARGKAFDINYPGRGGKFVIPFVIISDDDLISSPYGRGGLSGDTMRPPNSPNFFIHSYEVGNILLGPTINENELNYFISFVNNINDLMDEISIGENNYDFLECSLNSFVKSFFSEGFEELLWQMISLEALVGDKGDSEEGLTKRMGQRISTILGSDNDKKTIKKSFGSLYDLRSLLVHGSKINDPLNTSLLRIGRNLCRKTLLWFLHFLANFQKQTRGTDIKISQKDVSALIDFSRFTKGRLNNLLPKLPANFPYFKEWIE